MVLNGHDSPETAYVVDDYPYGFRQRCMIRYWVETRHGYGQRVVSQTQNPKTNKWNKPKAGVYSGLAYLYLSEDGHVHRGGCDYYSPARVKEVRDAAFDQFDGTQRQRFEAIESLSRRRVPEAWGVTHAIG
jgi:hypothetical protein